MIERGTQIAYVPNHANGKLSHPDVEFGFVVRVRGADALCRYWSKYAPDELRTKANGEWTPLIYLVEHASRQQAAVDAILVTL